MSIVDRASALGPYAQYLLDNEDVQASARRAFTASRDAYDRSRAKKGAAAQDRKVQRRVRDAAQAAQDVVGTIGRQRAKQQRKRRGRLALAVGAGVAAAGGALALVPQVREKVRSAFSRDSADAPPAP
jgi:hypothetical protein